MKVKFIIAGINKELPIIETDKINIKEFVIEIQIYMKIM